LGARRAVSIAAADVDVSAAVKLMHRDRETATLVQALAGLKTRVSSNLLEVELPCIAYRAQLPIERADGVLARIDLLPYSPTIRGPLLLRQRKQARPARGHGSRCSSRATVSFAVTEVPACPSERERRSGNGRSRASQTAA
jgi:hypothetical protein